MNAAFKFQPEGENGFAVCQDTHAEETTDR